MAENERGLVRNEICTNMAPIISNKMKLLCKSLMDSNNHMQNGIWLFTKLETKD